jgi:hypothetical protein
LKGIAEEYLLGEEKKNELGSFKEWAPDLRALPLPKLGSRQIDEIKRSEISRLLDRSRMTTGR